MKDFSSMTIYWIIRRSEILKDNPNDLMLKIRLSGDNAVTWFELEEFGIIKYMKEKDDYQYYKITEFGEEFVKSYAEYYKL